MAGTRRAAAARKTAKKSASAAGPRPPLVPQPNGRGALLAGGMPGNRGGTGRPRDEVRQMALDGAAAAVPKLVALLERDDDDIVVKAGKELLRYGLGPAKEISVDVVKGRLRETIRVLHEMLPPADAARVVAALRPVWSAPTSAATSVVAA